MPSDLDDAAEQQGRQDGRNWAEDLIETWGITWLATVTMGDVEEDEGAAWRAFKRCYGHGEEATDSEVRRVMFGHEPFRDAYISAFVAGAVEFLKAVKSRPQ